jgi:hypothetical protein
MSSKYWGRLEATRERTPGRKVTSSLTPHNTQKHDIALAGVRFFSKISCSIRLLNVTYCVYLFDVISLFLWGSLFVYVSERLLNVTYCVYLFDVISLFLWGSLFVYVSAARAYA